MIVLLRTLEKKEQSNQVCVVPKNKIDNRQSKDYINDDGPFHASSSFLFQKNVS